MTVGDEISQLLINRIVLHRVLGHRSDYTCSIVDICIVLIGVYYWPSVQTSSFFTEPDCMGEYPIIGPKVAFFQHHMKPWKHGIMSEVYCSNERPASALIVVQW